ncbi:hypothetical protein MBLNU459_g4563t1 [Dothideomycetes sp. NU459]
MDHRRPRAVSVPSYESYAVPLEPINPAPAPAAPPTPHGQNQSRAATPPSSSSNSNNHARLRRSTLADRRQPSIRIRRLSSSNNLRASITSTDFADADHAGASTRRRSSSEPQRFQHDDFGAYNSLPRSSARPGSVPLDTLTEEIARESDQRPDTLVPGVPHEAARRPGLFSRASTAALSAMRMNNASDTTSQRRGSKSSRDVIFDPLDEYDARLVDLLDVVDPEISTLSTLTNVQNSLFVPDLGRWLNRRPTYTLTRDRATAAELKEMQELRDTKTIKDANPRPDDTPAELTPFDESGERPIIGRSLTITSQLSETDDHYAVLPHGASLRGWTTAEKQELNDHVRHMLHSKRAAFKRSMKGFGQYVRRPLGFFVTLYATLITVFGLVWVLFLIGWIDVGGRKSYEINVIDNVLVALFAIMGDGLAPFRAVDTYHMIYIAHYHHLTWRLRKERDMPKLKDHNDLPTRPSLEEDVEATAESGDKNAEYDSVLSPEQQRKLKHHQDKFSKSHTFYKPHETETHHAFPLRLLITIVVLLDFHSIFQIALGTCTWSISYHVRPFALTTVILCCSLTCNITGGILISVGDKRTRKKDVIERMFRQQLTEEAMHKIEERRQREVERNDVLEETIYPGT